jgi:hypothetical protein
MDERIRERARRVGQDHNMAFAEAFRRAART